MRASRLLLSFGIAGNDRCDIETFRRLDQWSVKYRARDSIADEANAKRILACSRGVRAQYRSVAGWNVRRLCQNS